MPIQRPTEPMADDELIRILVERNERGADVYLQSPKLEAFFRSLSQGREGSLGMVLTADGPETETRGSHNIMRVLPQLNETECAYQVLGFESTALWASTEVLNLGLLTGKGLSEGYVIRCSSQALPRESLERWARRMQTVCARLYAAFIAPFSLDLRVSIRERVG